MLLLVDGQTNRQLVFKISPARGRNTAPTEIQSRCVITQCETVVTSVCTLPDLSDCCDANAGPSLLHTFHTFVMTLRGQGGPTAAACN